MLATNCSETTVGETGGGAARVLGAGFSPLGQRAVGGKGCGGLQALYGAGWEQVRRVGPTDSSRVSLDVSAERTGGCAQCNRRRRKLFKC